MWKLLIVSTILTLLSLSRHATAENMPAKEPSAKMEYMTNMEAMQKCNESFTIQMGFTEALNESGSFPDETDRTAKCYVRCVLLMTGVANEDAVYDTKKAAAIFAGSRGGKVIENAEDIANNCAKRDETCKCDSAYQFVKCMMEKEIELYRKS